MNQMSFAWGRYPYARVVNAGWHEALHVVIPVESNPYHELIRCRLLTEEIQDVLIPFAVETDRN